MIVISDYALKAWFVDHPEWSLHDNEITAIFKFKDFISAFGFMSQVAIYAEKQNHHPTMTNTYNTIKISICTHDADNKITDKDIKLAEAIESLT